MGAILHSIFTGFLAIITATFSPSGVLEKPKDSSFHEFFRFWSVGQGDLMTYVGKDVCWFFDLGGDHPLRLKSLTDLKSLCAFKKTSAYVSHFDKDHIQFFKQTDHFIPLNEIYFSHLDPETQLGKNLLKYFEGKGTKIAILKAGDETHSQNASLKCLWPRFPLRKDENSKSLVFLFENSHRRILLTGDLPSKVENLFEAPRVDVLKVAHHGSQGSTSEIFLSHLKPKTCIVSVGRHNKYRHPRKELLERLKKAQCSPLRTDELGTIQLNF